LFVIFLKTIGLSSIDIYSELQAHPNAERWRTALFPLYDNIFYLVNGVVATGASAFHPGRSISPTASEHSDAGFEPAESFDTSAATSQEDKETQSSNSGSDVIPWEMTPIPSVRLQVLSCFII
jgi:hypothetical protein